MSGDDQFAYFVRREKLERQMAEKSLDACSRRAHLTLADSYRRIVDSGELPSPRSRVSVG